MLRKIVVAVLVASLVTVYSSTSFGQPTREGAIREANVATPRFTSFLTGTRVWRETIIETGTRFLRLHFVGIVNTEADEGYEVVIRDFAFKKVFTYPKSVFGAKPDFWTGLIQGDTAVIEITAPKPPSGLAFTLKEYAFQTEPARVLSIVDPDEREPVAAYSGNRAIASTAKAVGKLSFLDGGTPVSCTGFMISDDVLMTNEHCINTQHLCDDAVIIFGYEITSDRRLSNGEQYRCVRFIKADYILDYALLQIDGDPGVSSRWGHLEMAARNLRQNEQVYMIGHPAGEHKQITKKGCMVQTPQAKGRGPDETDFGHLCDTLGGNSGSPILDTENKVIGLHHLGFSIGRWANENRAVRMKQIMEQMSPILLR